MELLKEIYRKKDLDLNGRMLYREAVRGIIIKESKILMIYSERDGDYKFPGGGVEEGETYEETLIREVKEESGASVTQILGEFGKVIEYDRPQETEFDLFKMTSYYFICEVSDAFEGQALDQYEAEAGFTPVWIDIDEAIEKNKLILESTNGEIPRWTPRETYILELINNSMKGFDIHFILVGGGL
jgi:ADP-ribose pyrophosphatase